MQVSKDTVVSIAYTLKDEDGRVWGSSSNQAPLKYVHGAGTLLPGLEDALAGKTSGDEVSVVIPPEKGYGLRDESLLQNVPRSVFQNPEQFAQEVLLSSTEEGPARLVRVVDADEDSVTLDANHELAGVTLYCTVMVLDVREATASEVERGHVDEAS